MHRKFICQTLLAIEQQLGQVRQSEPVALPVGSKSPPVEGPPPVDPLDPVEHDPMGEEPHPVKLRRTVATKLLGQFAPEHPAMLVINPQAHGPEPLPDPLEPEPEQQLQFG